MPTKRCLKQRLTRNDYSRVSTAWVKHLPFPDGYGGPTPAELQKIWPKNGTPGAGATKWPHWHDFPLLCRDSKTQLCWHHFLPTMRAGHIGTAASQVSMFCLYARPVLARSKKIVAEAAWKPPSCWQLVPFNMIYPLYSKLYNVAIEKMAIDIEFSH